MENQSSSSKIFTRIGWIFVVIGIVALGVSKFVLKQENKKVLGIAVISLLIGFGIVITQAGINLSKKLSPSSGGAA